MQSSGTGSVDATEVAVAIPGADVANAQGQTCTDVVDVFLSPGDHNHEKSPLLRSELDVGISLNSLHDEIVDPMFEPSPDFCGGNHSQECSLDVYHTPLEETNESQLSDLTEMMITRTRAVSVDDPPIRPFEIDMLDTPHAYSSLSTSRQRPGHPRQRRVPGALSLSSTTTLTSSTSSSLNEIHVRRQQHGLRSSLDSGMATLRRWVRSHSSVAIPSSTSATLPNSIQSVRGSSQNAAQRPSITTATEVTGTELSVSDDLFETTIAGHEFRSNDLYPTTINEEVGDHSFFDAQQHQRWQEETRRARTQSEPNVMRLRDYFFPSSSSPSLSNTRSIRRRRGRSRAHTESIPSSLSASRQISNHTTTPRQLSSSAAAVLHTSSSLGVASHQLLQDDPTDLISLPSIATTNMLGTSLRTDGFATDTGTVYAADIGGASSSGPFESVGAVSLESNAVGVVMPLSSSQSSQQGGGGGAIELSAMSDNGGNGDDSRINNGSGDSQRPHRSLSESQPVDTQREARMRWMRINRRFQFVITVVAIFFSLLLGAILLCWVVLTSTYVVSFEKSCDVPLKSYFWLVTLQLVLDVFRTDILKCVFRWDSTARDPIPCRIVFYNIAYLIYALLVLRLGVRSVFFEPTTCNETAPQLFNASTAFVSLSVAAWGTILCGYVLPLCVVAALLTYNGYNPSASALDNGEGTQAVFPAAYSTTGAPPWCIEQMQIVRLDDFNEDFPRECCICMENFHHDDIIVKTDCSHMFHKSCCREWLRQARTCPVCRADIPSTLEESPIEEIDSGDRLESNSRIPVGLTGRPVVGFLRILQGSDGDGGLATSSANTGNRGTAGRNGHDDSNHYFSARTPSSRQQQSADAEAMEEGRVSQRQLR